MNSITIKHNVHDSLIKLVANNDVVEIQAHFESKYFT